MREIDDLAALVALRRLELRRIGHLLPVVLVRAVPRDHFRFGHLPAEGTCLPVALVVIVVMIGAKRVPAVIAMAAIPRIGEHNVLVLVIADPLATASRPHKVLCRPADEALLFLAVLVKLRLANALCPRCRRFFFYRIRGLPHRHL